LSSQSSAQLTARDTAEMVATTRALLDAITPGDSAAWAVHLAPAWFETDEEGHHLSRTEFLAGMHPLPAGQSGQLLLGEWHLTGTADVAVMSYDIEETHHYYSQDLRTRFHSTDTYVRVSGRWWQIATQQTALPTPVDGIRIPAERLAPLAGTYALTSSIMLSIAVTDSGLQLLNAGRPPQRLYALSDQLFVLHGRRGVWVFEHGPDGVVTGLVYWRDNNGVHWKRT